MPTSHTTAKYMCAHRSQLHCILFDVVSGVFRVAASNDETSERVGVQHIGKRHV